MKNSEDLFDSLNQQGARRASDWIALVPAFNLEDIAEQIGKHARYENIRTFILDLLHEVRDKKFIFYLIHDLVNKSIRFDEQNPITLLAEKIKSDSIKLFKLMKQAEDEANGDNQKPKSTDG